MKPFHYGDEQCWINRNNGAQCFMEPAVAFGTKCCCVYNSAGQHGHGEDVYRRGITETPNTSNRHESRQSTGSATRCCILSQWTFTTRNPRQNLLWKQLGLWGLQLKAPTCLGNQHFEKKTQVVMPYSHFCFPLLVRRNKVEQFLLIQLFRMFRHCWI